MIIKMMSEESNNLVDDVMCTFPCVINTQSIYITDKCYYHYRIRESSTKRTVRNDVVDIIKNNYSDWLKRFNNVAFEKSIESQINFFIMYLLVSKAMYVFDDEKDNYCLKPYGGIEKGADIVLYGAGAVGIQLYNYISTSKCCNIIYWADRNYTSFKDLNVQSPGEIINIDADYVIISILNRDAYISAKNSLISMGISEKKIRWIDEKYLRDPKLLLEQCELFDTPKA